MWETAKRDLKIQKNKLKVLRVKNTRLQKKVLTLKHLIQHLQEKKATSQDGIFVLKVYFDNYF